MTRLRFLLLVLGPIPILGLSFVLSDALRSDSPANPVPNQVLAHPPRSDVYVADASTKKNPVVAHRPVTPSLEQPCRQAAHQLRERLGTSCNVVVHPPFVIAGNLTEAKLDVWYQQTIAPAQRAMAHRYFQTAPSEPVTILLFSTVESYDHYARQLFGDGDVSVYGYYKPRERTLVMNISTGGGTLVHELTHALMDFDFPNVPDWFNEGLASLHEQCRFRDDSQGPWIEGLENWRLPGLQATIRQDRLRSLRSMIEDDDFRGRLEGTNYAQARYFCLYMQRRGVLQRYFKTFRDHYPQDRRGLEAVATVFPGVDWEDLDRDFRAFVLSLKTD